MKKIKVTTSCSGFNFSFQQGQSYDVEDYIADDLIAVGYAEAIIEKKPEAPAKEEKAGSESKPAKAHKTSKKDVSGNVGA